MPIEGNAKMEQRNYPRPILVTGATAKAVAASIHVLSRETIERRDDAQLVTDAMEAFSGALSQCETRAERGLRNVCCSTGFRGFKCTAELGLGDGGYLGHFILSGTALSLKSVRDHIAGILAEATDLDVFGRESEDPASPGWQIRGAWSPSPYFEAPGMVG